MAPRSGLPAVKVKLPKELGGEQVTLIVRDAADLDLSWANLFKKREPKRYEQLFMKSGRRRRYIIRDNRSHLYRKEWELSTGLVSDFINSFKIVKAIYQATIVLMEGSAEYTRPGNMQSRISLPSLETLREKDLRSTRSRESEAFQVPSSSGVPRGPPTDSNSFRGGKPSAAAGTSREESDVEVLLEIQSDLESQHPRPGNASVSSSLDKPGFTRRGQWHDVKMNYDNDDAVSVDSMDSLSDVAEAGVEIKDVKSTAVQNLMRKVDNNTLLRVVKELKLYKGNGNKWLRMVSRVPVTAHLMQVLLPDILEK